MFTDFSIAKNPVIIDVDGATDDFLAILYALKSKEFDVRGITYQGDGWSHAGSLGTPGCTYQKSVPESNLGKREHDLLYGLNRQLKLSKRIWYDAIKGFNITKNFADLIDSTIKQTGKKTIIIITGPATNIATLLRAFPTYTKKIHKVFWMGRALNVHGNLHTVPNNIRAEFNVFLDCVAAQELLDSNLDITLVPLDFTSKTPFNASFFDELSKLKSFYDIFVYKLLSTIRSIWPGGDSAFFTGYYLWDPITIAVAKNIGVAKIFVSSNILTKSKFKIAIDAIVGDPIESSPFFQDFLN
ncbi:18984_t:CDS:2, partial [Dentiscutata erythropus]